MKNLLVFVCFLVLVVACTNQPANNENITANANKGTEMKSTAPPSEADIIAKEKEAWEAFRSKNADAFKKLLAPEYIEVFGTGPQDTAAAIAGMKDLEIADVTFADWKMIAINKDAAIITYTATQKGTYKGKPFPSTATRKSSAWVKRNGEWLAIYFQETMVQPPAPKVGSNFELNLQNKGTKASASPEKPAESGPDPIVNEKLVWDSFRSKNYDAFASYLANDFIEVEPEAVYDKAGSVKEVQRFDLSKAELSEWRTVKLDNDASLVIYKAKIPGLKPDTGYHTTIWANRDNKWQAVFHMGTPVEKVPPATPEKKP